MKISRTPVTVGCMLLVAIFFLRCVPDTQTDSLDEYLNFPSELSPSTPYDVDQKLQAQLTAQGEFDEVQRLFDILSWQFFVSLNWPRDEEGLPLPKIADEGDPIWFSWKESFEVFKQDGSAPLPLGEFEAPAGIKSDLISGQDRILFRTSKFAEFQHPDVADEIDQAFTTAIYDQSGNAARYEVRMNNVEFGYIVKNELYNYDGQIAFYADQAGKDSVVNFPRGSRDIEGVFEVKIAWKIMVDGVDVPERYFTTEAQVVNEDGSFSAATVGMIGMHISTKTESAPQWIWATFEHVDNLETNPLIKVNGKPVQPSFNDPDCAICAINSLPEKSNGKFKNQIQRVIPIAPATEQLNVQVQGMLSQADSRLAYYQLVGTQWPTRPDARAYTYSDSTVYTLPDAITNKSGGYPTPVYLTNMIMETYFQGGTITKSPSGADTFLIRQTYIQGGEITLEDTITGYNVYNSNEPAFFQIQGAPVGKDLINTQRKVFGTESCMACHFSASIAKGFTVDKNTGQKSPVFAAPADADFSWLLQLKAHFKTLENSNNE